MRILSYIALALLGLVVVYVLWKILTSIPDLVRYMRIRSM